MPRNSQILIQIDFDPGDDPVRARIDLEVHGLTKEEVVVILDRSIELMRRADVQ